MLALQYMHASAFTHRQDTGQAFTHREDTGTGTETETDTEADAETRTGTGTRTVADRQGFGGLERGKGVFQNEYVSCIWGAWSSECVACETVEDEHLWGRRSVRVQIYTSMEICHTATYRHSCT